MYTTYVYQPSTGAIVEITHNSPRAAQRSMAHRTAYGGIELHTAENPTNDATYYHPCTRFCNGECINIFCADSERGDE